MGHHFLRQEQQFITALGACVLWVRVPPPAPCRSRRIGIAARMVFSVLYYAPLAQLAEASDLESEGSGFESLMVYHFSRLQQSL